MKRVISRLAGALWSHFMVWYQGNNGTNPEGRAIMDFPADATKFEWPLNQGDIDILNTQGAILFVGNGGLTVTKWYVK
jgi:hypothetical protein